MNVAAFLFRSLAWALGGLAIIKISQPQGIAQVIFAIGWLCGLAGIGIEIARSSDETARNWSMAWLAMALAFIALLALTLAMHRAS